MKNNSFLLACIFTISLMTFFSCNSDRTIELPEVDEREIWTGTTTTFEKADDASPDEASNQDRITDKIWITRGNTGNEIFNIKDENSATKGSSPSGTQWAIGTISDIDNLDFKSFRGAIDKPKDVVGKDLVLFLTADNIFISVKFTKWSSGKAGGFAYERSTK